jgi:hypothetical protein
MAKFDVFKKRSMDADIAVSGVSFVVPPEMSFEVKAELDSKVYEQVAKDSILLTEMNKAADKIYEQTCKGIKSKISAFDSLVETMLMKGASKADIEKQLDGLNNSIWKDRDIAEAACTDAVEKVWKDYGKKKKEYAAYKIKIVLSIVGSLAGLVTSITLMSTAPFTGGASAGLALTGMLKSAVQIGKELVSAWQTIETSLKLLAVQADIVEKAAKTMLGRKANEYTAAAITQFLGIAQPSIKSCKSHLETVQAKLKGVEINTHEASVKINELLDQQETLKKDFMKDVSARAQKAPHPNAKDQAKDIEKELDQFIGKSRSDIIKQKDVVSDLYKRFKSLEEEVDERAKKIEEIADKRDIDERLLRLIASAVDLPLGIHEAVASKSANLAAEIASNLAPWVADLAYEKMSDKVLDKTFLAK